MPLRIANAVDLHCHCGLDALESEQGISTGLGVPAVDAAREAADSGYAALVLKSHTFPSVSVAESIDKTEPRLRVFGGICTDHPIGGLNVYAVESALALGAKIVWLPTLDSVTDFKHRPASPRHTRLGPVKVVDDAGSPLPAVREIAELVGQADAILATGHISAGEHYATVKAFAQHCHVLVTHAGEELAGPHLTPAQAAELAALGATIELTAMMCQPVRQSPGHTPMQILALIRAVGPSRCVLSSDYGWSATRVPHPVPGLRDFLESLWEQGLGEGDLHTMVSANPARLLRLGFAD
jgi:hypothetical protein